MRNKWLHKRIPMLALMLALVLFVLSMAGNDAGRNTDGTASEVAWRIEKRLKILDDYVSMMVESDNQDFRLHEILPEDMVIYRYVNDSLYSWNNQFSTLNDDISYRLLFYRLSDGKSNLTSPLREAGEEISYMNIGPKWYLVKAVTCNDNQKIIAGLEIKNTLIDDARRNENGVNPRFKLPGKYSALPLNNNGGSAVEIDGKPLFKVIYDSGQAASFFDNSILRWLSVFFFLFSLIMFIAGHRTLKVYAVVTSTMTVLLFMSFIWAVQMNGTSELFSPTVYADGPILFSLGALLMINTYITLMSVCSFFIRNRMAALARKDRRHIRRNFGIYGSLVLISIIGIAIYTNYTLQSLLLNSNVSLELYRWNSNMTYTVMVYVSYTGLLFSILLHLQVLRPTVKQFTGLKYDMLDYRTLVLFAIVCSAYFTVVSSTLGFQKEEDRTSVWANRLSVERNLSLEIKLRSVEESIAYDRLISAMTSMDGPENLIRNRITDYYLTRIRHPYNIDVKVFKEGDLNGQILFSTITHSGTPIARDSHFLFLTDANGQSRYAGIFVYYHPDRGTTRMILMIEPNTNREDKGYFSIIGMYSKPGDINIPQYYSYAKYREGRLVSYKGNYPYPTYYDYAANGYLKYNNTDVGRFEGYVHFMNLVGEDELIIISRPQRSGLVYFTSFSYLCLALCGILSIFSKSRGKKKMFKSNYFRTRINTVLFMSSFLILVSLTVISILFVYKRNEDNMNNLMSSKITTIQALVQKQARSADNWSELNTQEFASAIENISNTTKSDITLYTPGGKVFRSTTPEVFERMIIGSRIDETAFYNIRDLHQRFYIHREKINEYAY